MILLNTDNMLFHYEIRNVSEISFFSWTIGRISKGLINEFELVMANQP